MDLFLLSGAVVMVLAVIPVTVAVSIIVDEPTLKVASLKYGTPCMCCRAVCLAKVRRRRVKLEGLEIPELARTEHGGR